VARLRQPLPIDFDEATSVAVLGLAVNLVSARLLSGRVGSGAAASPSGKGHDHSLGHRHDNHDHNLQAAYLHVLADALTSFLAIFALLSGKYFGWFWMDPLMGVVGSVIIARWSIGLLRSTSRVLLDGDVEPALVEEVRRAIEAVDDSRVTDLHLWRVGPGALSAIVCIATHHAYSPDDYKLALSGVPGLGHVTVEINRCPGDPCDASLRRTG
jgi:cation diffusion facilitator family transporter